MTLTINEINFSINELQKEIDFFDYRIDNLLTDGTRCRDNAIKIRLRLKENREVLESYLKTDNKNQLFLGYIIGKCKGCSSDINFNDVYKTVDSEYYCQDCYVECADCREILDRNGDTYNNDDNDIICETCYNDTYFYCVICDHTARIDDSHSVDNTFLCDSCFNQNYINCHDCGEPVNNDYSCYSESDGETYCENCYCDNGHGEEERGEWDSQTVLNYKENTFNLIPSKKCFGIEIEVSNNDVDFDWIENNTCFGGKADSSLNCGMELYSPILRGDVGYREIKKVYEEIDSRRNDDSAGVHLHIDMREDKDDFQYVKKLYYTYVRIENMIYKVINPRRNESSFCIKSGIDCNRIYNFVNYQELREVYNSRENYHGSRYFGFSLTSLRYHQTIELRYKDSKLDFSDLINWIKLHLYIFDYVKNNSIEKLKRITANINGLDRFITFLGIISRGDYDLINYWIRQFNHYNK